MARTKKAARSHKQQIGAGGGGGGGEGRSQRKKKKQPQNTNKQSAKQRIRAEAAERSRLSRKANQALQRRVEREQAATTRPSPGPGASPDANDSENSSALARTPASRAEQRETVQQDVEARLSIWRRKRARAEAGLPDDSGNNSSMNNNNNNNNNNNPDRRRTPERPSIFPTAYYPGQASGGGGGGRVPTGDGALLGGSGAMGQAAWPDVYNAPVRRCLPGHGRNLLGSPFLAGGSSGGGGARKKHRGEEATREAEERWEAPWMLGLVDRSPHGGGGGGGGGDSVEPVDLVSSDDEKGQVQEGMLADKAVEQRCSEGQSANAVQTYGGGGGRGGGNEARHADAGRSERGGWERGRGGEWRASADEGLSDLHHELLMFEEYVSLTPAEVAAREGLVASIEVSAGEALGHGATARAFGSYGGGRTQAQSDCFSIFLSDVDISVRPPADRGLLPPQGQELQPAKPPRARTALGGFLDLSRRSDDGFEEGSSSSSAGTSSSSEGSSSDFDTGSESGSDSDSDNIVCLLRIVSAAAAAASAAGEAIYVASSGSEAQADDCQDRAPQNRTRETTTRSPSGADATAARHLDAAAALTETETETDTSALSGGGVGRQGDDGGPAGCRGGIADPSEEAGKEQQAGSETGPTAAEEALGFYVDCRPDPELLKLVAKEREAANNGNSGASGGERLTQGKDPGEELFSGSSSGGGAARGVGRGDRPPTEPKPISSRLRAEPVEEGAPRAQREAAPASKPAGFGRETAPRVACDSSSSVAPKGKGKGKKRPRSSSPSSMRSLQSASSVGGGGNRLSIGASGDGGDKEGGDGRLRVVLKPDGGGWTFVNGKEKCSDNNTADPQDGGEEEEEEEEEDEDSRKEKSASATSSLQRKDGSSDAIGPAATLYDMAAAAASCTGETAAQLAERLRAESERTARLTADAATWAAKFSSARGDGAATESSASAPPPNHGWRLAFPTDGGDVECGGGGGGGNGARRSGSKDPDQVERGKGTWGKGGETKGDRNDGDGTDGNSEGEEEEDREAKHAGGLMALVREQEKRNRGGTLPSAFLPPTASNGQGEGRAGESSRAARLQAALTVAAGAAAKRKLSSGTVAPPGGALEIRARPGLANGGGVAGAPWRGGTAGAKARAVAGLRKLGKRLLRMPWVEKFEFRSRARVPIIAMVDARGGVECDLGWGGDDGRDDPADAPGPAYFADMFPGTFRPLALFLKVFMRQRGLDKPFTGGLGSFKLYALIASHLQACGCGRAQQQHDLGDLLLSFLRRYSVASRERISPTTVLRIKGLTVGLGSAFRASVASKDFTRAFEALSCAVEEEANRANRNIRTATPVVLPRRPGEKSSENSHHLKGNKKGKRNGHNNSDASGSMSSNDSRFGVESRHRQPEHDARQRRRRRSSILGRVVWGSDLRRERESRLAAVGCAKTSPHPACPEPHWHVKLEATYHSDGGTPGTGKSYNNKGLLERYSRGARTPWSHGPKTSSGRGHAYVGCGPSNSNPNRRDASKRRGGDGGGGGGGGGGGDDNERSEEPFWWANNVQKKTKAQKKRAKLKRDAEEIEIRKRKKKQRGSPNAQAATAGAKSKKRKKAGGASSGHDATGSAETAPRRKKKMTLPGF